MGMIPRKPEGTASAPAAAGGKIPPKATPAPAPAAGNTVDAAATVVSPAPTAAPVEAPVPAPAAAGTVSTKVAKKQRNAIEENFKGKVPLEWNTLPRIQANQGNFLDLEANKAPFGNTIVVQIMSYQPSWQCSPGTDDPNDLQYVRYSDDGETTTKGENLKAHLASLIEANYDKAKISARYLIGMVIEETPGDPTGRMLGKLVQIDMSETSKKAFDAFMMQTSFQEAKGMITPEVAESGRIKMTANVTSRGNFSWTKIDFAHAPAM